MGKRKRSFNKRLICDHCNQSVSHDTYYRHKRMVKQKENANKWTKKRYADDSSTDEEYNPSFTNEVSMNKDEESLNTQSNLNKIDPVTSKIELILRRAKSIYQTYLTALEHSTESKQQAEEELTQELLNLDGVKCVTAKEKRKRKEAVWTLQEYLASLDQDVPQEESEDMCSSDSEQEQCEGTGSSDSETDGEWQCFKDKDIDDIRMEMLRKANQPLINKTSTLSNVKGTAIYLLYFLLLWKSLNVVSNNAFENILRFLPEAISSIEPNNQAIISFVALFPTSLYAAWKIFGINKVGEFAMYIVCPKCTAIFKPEDMISVSAGIKRAKTCNNVPFPSSTNRKLCGEPLFRQIRLKNGDIDFVPLKIYPYKSPIDSLETLLSRGGVEDECNKWRSRSRVQGEYGDIYDGSIWEKFLRHNGTNFLESDNNYGIMINVDWFQPFQRRNDISVGVLYGVIMNLPRHLRFKRENLLLIGIIPALNKEPESLNTFLRPFVDDMKSFWHGVRLKTFKQPNSTIVRCAVLCASADIPAVRKLCGFLGHSAHRGCSKCFKLFPGGFGEKSDYSGFDKSRWPKRSNLSHRRSVNTIQNCKTKTSRKKMESQLGCRYSALLDLPYFDIIAQHVVDPMHNLFLGTAKHMFRLWIDRDILSKEKLRIVEEKLKSVELPHDYGRLPNNISSNWGGFTADQWKNWTLVFSLFCLKGVLPPSHYKVWHTFTQACRIIVRPSVSTSGLKIADMLFIKFGKEVEKLYGASVITCNMHLHCHLSECIERFGSVYGFWLFSFERYNGMLAGFNTNRRNIEVQLMREFLNTDALYRLFYELPVKGFEKLNAAINSILFQKQVIKYSEQNVVKLHKLAMSSLDSITLDQWTNEICLEKPSFCTSKTLQGINIDCLNFLLKCYQCIYPKISLTLEDLSKTCFEFDSIHICSEYYSSKRDFRGRKNALVLASWNGDDIGSIKPSGLRPGLIKKYVQHSVKINGEYKIHVFAVVKWFQEYEDGKYPNPISSWKLKEYVPAGHSSFIPVQRLYGKLAIVTDKYAMHVAPLYRRIKL